MTSNPYSTEIRQELITSAQSILDDETGIISGSREIVSMLRELDIRSDDKDVETFFKVNTETSSFVLDSSGAFPDPAALAAQDEAITRVESQYAHAVHRACARLIQRMERQLERDDIPSDYLREEAAQSAYIASEASTTFDKIRAVFFVYVLAFVAPITLEEALQATEQTWTRDGPVWMFFLIAFIAVFAYNTWKGLKESSEGRWSRLIWLVAVPWVVFTLMLVFVFSRSM